MNEAQPAPTPAAPNPHADGYLYHYTDPNAFRGIMEHFSLWATQIEYLNDASEHKLATGAVIDEGFARINAAGADNFNPADSGHLMWQRTLSYMWQYPYIACFTEDGGDRVSQWRGYGGGAGVCLQFRKPELQVWCEGHDIQLKGVNYIADGDETLRAEIRGLFDNMPSQEQQLQDWAHYTAAFYKDETLKEEQEWRMVTKRLKPLRHRVRGSLLIPYVEVKIEKPDLQRLLAGVIIGPTVHRALTEKSLKGLLAINGFAPPLTKVRCSKIPLRDY